MQKYDSKRDFWFIFLDGVHRRVDFIDTSDICEFPAMKRVYIQSGDAFVVVYAIDDERSYEIAKALCEEIYNIKGLHTYKITFILNFDTIYYHNNLLLFYRMKFKM